MSKILTDRKLLKSIYKKYYVDFCSFDKANPSRASKIYVPIDCEELAKEFSVDKDIIFGRLYYHLDKKYGYRQEDGTKVPLFSMKAGEDRNVIHFPLLSAVLADMEESNFRFLLPIILSSAAIAISILTYTGSASGGT